MKRIALISDTHGYFAGDLIPYLSDCDELWHAGDIGGIETADRYAALCPVFRAVYGNIDDALVRRTYPGQLKFELEGVRVFLIHIGGYPGKYERGIKEQLERERTDLFISGPRQPRQAARAIFPYHPGDEGS